jgi:hypothetical protein
MIDSRSYKNSCHFFIPAVCSSVTVLHGHIKFDAAVTLHPSNHVWAEVVTALKDSYHKFGAGAGASNVEGTADHIGRAAAAVAGAAGPVELLCCRQGSAQQRWHT